MNIFRFGRADFSGTFIPGALLLANVLFLCPQLTGRSENGEGAFLDLGDAAIALPVLFGASHVLGFAFRSVVPGFAEILSRPLKSLECVVRCGIGQFWHWLCSGQAQGTVPRLSWEPLRTELRRYPERFPYIDWFFDVRLCNGPLSCQTFFNGILDREFNGDMQRMKGLGRLDTKKS